MPKRFLVIQIGVETTAEKLKRKKDENEIRMREIIIRLQSLQGFSKDFFTRPSSPLPSS